jgi:5-methyltetrahydrofolate--homocysteine methyltransferase
MSGTSMAAPIVTAAATLLYAKDPSLSAGERAAGICSAARNDRDLKVSGGMLDVEGMLEEKTAPLDIINNFIIPALNTVGEGFGKKTLFLPQLLMAADAAKAAFDELKKQMQAGGTESSARGDTIVLAVVKGDIHDIGKNIVKVLWENYGYHVVDLGKDVPAESVVEAVEKHQAKLVGLTALMTTTVAAMEETISALRDATDTKILVGGAVMTQEYADTIGADGYAPDAVAAVDYANRIFREEKE